MSLEGFRRFFRVLRGVQWVPKDLKMVLLSPIGSRRLLRVPDGPQESLKDTSTSFRVAVMNARS